MAKPKTKLKVKKVEFDSRDWLITLLVFLMAVVSWSLLSVATDLQDQVDSLDSQVNSLSKKVYAK